MKLNYLGKDLEVRDMINGDTFEDPQKVEFNQVQLEYAKISYQLFKLILMDHLEKKNSEVVPLNKLLIIVDDWLYWDEDSGIRTGIYTYDGTRYLVTITERRKS